VKNADGWLQYEDEVVNLKSWKDVRLEFFDRFVDSRKSAKEAFKTKRIEDGQSPEKFLFELRLYADVSGIALKPNYTTILRDQFLYGMRKAPDYAYYYMNRSFYKNVSEVIKEFKDADKLKRDRKKELKPQKEFYSSKLAPTDKDFKQQKKAAIPYKAVKTGEEKYGNKRATALNLQEEMILDIEEEEEKMKTIPEEDVLDQESLRFNNLNLHDKAITCSDCGGNHNSIACFKSKPCKNCKDMGHSLINCYRLCRCRLLLSFKSEIAGVPHSAKEVCPINWELLLGSMNQDSAQERSGSKN
jgi:hypothetical protein